MPALSVGSNLVAVSLTNVTVVVTLRGSQCEGILLECGGDQTNCSKQQISDVTVPVCSALCELRELFVCCNHKSLCLWNTSDWKLIHEKKLKRAASSVTFSPTGSEIVVADKAGDVYLYNVNKFEDDKGLLILGHVSMLLDILITPDGKFIISCDRDEKIRVSKYPQAYCIQSYCLGHTEFVTTLTLLNQNEQILVSGGGDGTVRFWDYTAGKQITYYTFPSGANDSSTVIVTKLVSLKRDAMSSFLLALVHELNEVIVFVIVYHETNISFHLGKAIVTNSAPLNIAVNRDNYLYVFKNDCHSRLLVYNMNNADNELVQCLCKEYDNMNTCLVQYNELFLNDVKKKDLLNSFYKRKFDDVQEYAKRKFQRKENCLKKLESESAND